MLAYLRPWLTNPTANAAARAALESANAALRTDGDAIAKIVDVVLSPSARARA